MIGERVKHAREYCGMTQTALGELADLLQGRISDIEAGRVTAKPEEVRSVARATGFPVSFFNAGPLPDLPDGHFRRLKRGKLKVGAQVRAQARQIVTLVQRAEPQLIMPPVRLEPVTRYVDLEAVAQAVRREAGVGQRDPIPNLTRAIERAGVIVAGLPNEIPGHDGFSVWPDFALGGRPVIVFARSSAGDRQRFTIAHEIGHLLLHSPQREDAIEAADAEREAHRFAGALLLPAEAAADAMRPPLTLTTLAHVKATYGISIGAAIQRGHDLDLINDSRFVSLRKQLTTRGWHRSEPVVVAQEAPLLIRKVLDLLGSGATVSERAESVQMPVFGFRALLASN